MIPIIISGGSGSRLWPMSRVAEPKPFLKLSDGRSLLQNTFIRASKLPDVKQILTVTNNKVHFRMQDEYQAVNDSHIICDFILEPIARNTAPAVAAAAQFVVNNYAEDELILIMPADHLISDFDQFAKAVESAAILARDGYLVTFGINPEYPETGYGYIQINREDKLIDNCYKVQRFVEKPNAEDANLYVDSGNYKWNSGMFIGKASTFIKELNKYSPLVLNEVSHCLDNSKVDVVNGGKIVNLDLALFNSVESISIDYALFEKSANVAVVACSIGWSDIGSWLSIAQTLPHDGSNNAVIGDAILHNVDNCLVYSTTNRIVAGVDLDSLIIVDTPDALLVANKYKSQDVKFIFEKLKKMEHKTSELHQTVHRPWGTYTVLEEGAFYKIKRIEVKPGQSLSLQLHHCRSEHWIVVEGIATVTNGDNIITLLENQSTYINKETKHRLVNNTDKKITLIEVQCGDYLGEDDIVRFDDIYGRIQ